MRIFENNYMEINSGKWNLIISDNISKQILAWIREHKTWESMTVKLSGIPIENNLIFDEDLITSNICMKSMIKQVSCFNNFSNLSFSAAR